MELELTWCPDCGRTAEVIDRVWLPSNEGPLEHVKTRCITGPWFMTLVENDHLPSQSNSMQGERHAVHQRQAD
jgi:hypothetical protein